MNQSEDTKNNNNLPSQESLIKFDKSLLSRAKANDFDAVSLMFRQFIEENETIEFAEYLGLRGLWGIGNHSFACITNKRIASIQTGSFGEVLYQDGWLEELNSNVIYQPSIFLLYLLAVLVAIPTLGLGLILFPIIVKAFYGFKKCGFVTSVREGVPVYIFSDRKRISRVNHLLRTLSCCREKRKALLR